MDNAIELIFWPDCTLKCTYCYVHPHPDNFVQGKVDWISNVKKAIPYVRQFNRIELFGGEILVKQTGRDILDMLLEEINGEILIPSNGTWVLDDKAYKHIQDIYSNYPNKLHISFSTDGLYGDVARFPNAPDLYYERMFEFAKTYGAGFHPMIHSSNIAKWKENFIWFKDNYDRYGLNLKNLYLLEVRNADWDKTSCKLLAEFITFLVEQAHSMFEDFEDFILKGRGFNILSSPLIKTSKGLGCSIQTTVALRLADLTIFPCHRLMYPNLKAGQLIDGVIKWGDVNTYDLIKSFDFKSQPICKSCLIKNMCSLGCLGAQYEYSKDFTAPIPTVCMMEHYKLYGWFEGMERVGWLTRFMENSSKKQDLLNFKEIIDEL